MRGSHAEKESFIENADSSQLLLYSHEMMQILFVDDCSQETYRIAGNFGEVFNLTIWRIRYRSPDKNSPIELNACTPMQWR